MLHQMLIIIGVTSLVMISPGPDMVIVFRNTLISGRTAGFLTSLGVLAGNLVHISYCIVGIGWLISQSILAFNLLKFAGAAYLIYLGITSLRTDGATSLDIPSLQNRGTASRKWFLQGFLNNVLNPKGTLFYLGVFTVVITPETVAPVVTILVATMITVSALFWLVFVVTLDRPSVRRVLERGQKTVNRVFGVALIALGVRVATLER